VFFDRGRSRCVECDSYGDGKCARCYGTGVNLKLNSDSGKCDFCDGTGHCAGCNGTGVACRQQSPLSLGEWLKYSIGRLWNKLVANRTRSRDESTGAS